MASKRREREAFQASQASKPHHADLPKKRLYRQRAHANPFSDHDLTYPSCPEAMDWSTHYPAYLDTENIANDSNVCEKHSNLCKNVTIADIGCGFGGLLVALSTLCPDDLVLGLEIRYQVATYVHDRIIALRRQNSLGDKDESQLHQQQLEQRRSATETRPDEPVDETNNETKNVDLRATSTLSPKPSRYQNISVVRANTMKFLPNFFAPSSLQHIFLCFPDPHFKARKHKARIVSDTLCAEYAYVLRPGGCVWTITDVEELADWMARSFASFGCMKSREGETRLHSDSKTSMMNGEEDMASAESGTAKTITTTKTTATNTMPMPKRDDPVPPHGLFERVPVPVDGEEDDWPDQQTAKFVKSMRMDTEEGKKVSRNGGTKFVSVWRRRGNPPWPDEDGDE